MKGPRYFLSRVRALFGAKNVIYGEGFFTDTWFENWAELQTVLAELVLAVPEWRRVLDFGCGPGIMIDLMNEHGLDYTGFDPSLEARALYSKHYGKYPNKYLNVIHDKKFDAVLSFDVLEHMSDEEIVDLNALFSDVRDLFVNISRAPGIPGHINLKSDEEWIAFFAENGRSFDKVKTALLREKYVTLRPTCCDAWNENMFVFTR